MLTQKTVIQSIVRNPWPWALFGLPVLTMVAGVITIALAVNSDDGLVADDYYKQGLAINQALARDEAAKRHGLRASVSLKEGRLYASVAANAAYPLPRSLVMRWTHPTQAGADQILSLTEFKGEGYVADLPPLAVGRWNVSIEDPSREWRLVTATTLPFDGTLELAP